MGVGWASLSWSIPLGTMERKLGIAQEDLFFPTWRTQDALGLPWAGFWVRGWQILPPAWLRWYLGGFPSSWCPSPKSLHACWALSPSPPPQSWDVAELLETHIPPLFFPQGDTGQEGDRGVPGEAGRRVNGTPVPTRVAGSRELLLGARAGSAGWSQFSGCSESLERGSRRDEGCWDRFGATCESFICGPQGKRGKMGQQPPRGPWGHKVGGFVRLPCPPGSLGVFPPA